jgi:pyridoxine 5-phosphate synthase
MIEGAKQTVDRIELYWSLCAWIWFREQKRDWSVCKSSFANELGLGINAGHDLSLDNIRFFKENIQTCLKFLLVMR